MTTYQDEDTIRLTAAFKNWADNLADTTTLPAIKIADANRVDITPTGATVIRDSLGTYHYDYTVPAGISRFYYRFYGMSEGTLVSRRGEVSLSYV